MWAVYWLHYLAQVANEASGMEVVGAGTIIHLGELLVLGLALISALPAVALWLPGSRGHFD